MRHDPLRRFVRTILIESLASGVSEHTLMQVTKFVSGETLYKDFDLDGCLSDLRPFLKVYRNLYRVWQHHAEDVPLATIEADARSRGIMSATQDPSTIPVMLDMFGNDEQGLAVTTFDGEGFDPYEVIRVGLAQHPDFKERGFARAVLQQYGYQQEVIVLRVVGPMKKV